MAQGIAWHVKWYAYLIQKFLDTPEAGGTMLDNISMPFVFEGGHGYDPEQNRGPSSHSTENMVVMLAGRAGGLKPGKHIRKTNNVHPAAVMVSAMKAVGYTGSSLGEVTAEVPELYGFRPVPQAPLPFPSTVVASTDDPWCTFDRATALARAWGSHLVDLGARGHINSDSGLGDWPEGRRILADLTARTLKLGLGLLGIGVLEQM